MTRVEEYYEGLSRHIDFSILPDPTDKFELLDIIGEGTYGEVYASKETATGKLFIITKDCVFLML